MANENESFIREVNEQIRSEKLSNFWGRYGVVVVGAAILVVLSAAGAGVYEYWNNSRASSSGDQFASALKLASEGKNDEALKAFSDLGTAGHGSYPGLARCRRAMRLAQLRRLPQSAMTTARHRYSATPQRCGPRGCWWTMAPMSRSRHRRKC